MVLVSQFSKKNEKSRDLFSFEDLNKPLDRALNEWSALLNRHDGLNVRNSKQTCHSIAVMAALFRLMGKVSTENVLVFFVPFLFFLHHHYKICNHRCKFCTRAFFDLHCIYFFNRFIGIITHYILSLGDNSGNY